MFKKLVFIATAVALFGCTQLKTFTSTSTTAVETWWNSPATQQGLQIGEQAAQTALVSGAETAALDYASGGQIHWTEVGKAAGSGALRQIEMTPTASQPVVVAAKVADAMLQASHNPAQAQSAKTAVIAGLTAAKASGANASGALEGIAQALDAQPSTDPAPGK